MQYSDGAPESTGEIQLVLADSTRIDEMYKILSKRAEACAAVDSGEHDGQGLDAETQGVGGILSVFNEFQEIMKEQSGGESSSSASGAAAGGGNSSTED